MNGFAPAPAAVPVDRRTTMRFQSCCGELMRSLNESFVRGMAEAGGSLSSQRQSPSAFGSGPYSPPVWLPPPAAASAAADGVKINRGSEPRSPAPVKRSPMTPRRSL